MSTPSLITSQNENEVQNGCTIFGKAVSPGTIKCIAIVAAFFLLIPTTDVWQMPPKHWGGGGFFTGISKGLLSFALEIPQWLSVLISGTCIVLLLAALENKVEQFGSKDKKAVKNVRLCVSIFTIVAFCAAIVNDEVGADDDDAAMAVMAIVLLIVLFALAFTLIYAGLRLKKYSDEKYSKFCVYAVIYPIALFVVGIISAVCGEYSLGAKIMGLLDAGLSYVFLALLTGSLVPMKMDENWKEEPLYLVGTALLILHMLLVFNFGVHPYNTPTVAERQAIEAINSGDYAEADTAVAVSDDAVDKAIDDAVDQAVDDAVDDTFDDNDTYDDNDGDYGDDSY